MLFKHSLRLAVLSTFLLALTGIAMAQGPAIGTSTTSNLNLTTTVETAVQLNISTNTTLTGATVTGSNSTGVFALSFGNVNGLGLGTPTAGISVVADGTGATYFTPITLTPVYSGFATAEKADVTVEAGDGDNQSIVLEGSTENSLSSVSDPAPVITNADSGSSNTRYVGFRIARTEEAGAKAATLIYTVTVN